MRVKIKKLIEEATIPSYSKLGDAGMDLTATSKTWNQEHELYEYGTGLAIEIPEGHVGLLFPRSSICKTPFTLSNHVGVIDSNYRGEIKAMFRPGSRLGPNYEVGHRIVQLIILPYPTIELEETDTLSETNRGSSGFGGSGK